jgi:hypothetical protein
MPLLPVSGGRPREPNIRNLTLAKRRPRHHPKVQEALKVLVECVRRMPSTGTLFTSQSPLFPVFVMGFVAVDEEERDVARKWFETVLSCDTSRSVGLLWKSIQC